MATPLVVNAWIPLTYFDDLVCKNVTTHYSFSSFPYYKWEKMYMKNIWLGK